MNKKEECSSTFCVWLSVSARHSTRRYILRWSRQIIILELPLVCSVVQIECVRSFGSCRKLSIYLSGQECVFKTNLIAHLLTKCAHTHALCFDLNHVRLHARLLTKDMKQMERNILDPSTEHGGNKGGCVLLVQRTSVYN